MVRLFTCTVGDMTALVIYKCNQLSQYLKQVLENAVAKIGNWEIMCEHLGVHKAVLNGLCNIDTDGTIERSIYL